MINMRMGIGKILMVISLFSTICFSGTIKDSRDGQTYRTVKIGNQVWMAENLNYKTKESVCYDNKESNCKKYGRLYTWKEAKKTCPAGWHLPSVVDFDTLLATTGASEEGYALNLRVDSWEFGFDKFGFSALPAGFYNNIYKEFYGLDGYAYFWSSTESDVYSAYSLNIYDHDEHVVDGAGVNRYDKNGGHSVRCLRDSNEGSEVSSSHSETQPSSGTLKDTRDGKTYNTVKIGNQVWMAENLNYKTNESVCYDNKENNCKKYGRLYTWKDAKKACPAGWRLPSKGELESLLVIMGSGENRSLNLRVDSWENGSDKFGFSALPAGYYISNFEKFDHLGNVATFWSSTESDIYSAYDLGIGVYYARVSGYDKSLGRSVRCLQDSNEGGDASSFHSEAQPSNGTLKDSRDGKIYKTVKKGNQVWMAENLNYKTSESVCYDNKESNCKKYGRLYTWKEAKKACPAGWRLPNRGELESLLVTMESDEDRSLNLRVDSWENGFGRFGISILPAGVYVSNAEKFGGLGITANFWSSMEYSSFYAYGLSVYDGGASVSYGEKSLGRSVRCLQDSNEGSEESSSHSETQPSSGTLKDTRDGKTYKTVKIGNQTWMAENLNYEADGSVCYGNKDANCKKYGRLYTWGDALDACPAGWHLPNSEEFESLLVTMGSDEDRSLNLRVDRWKNGADKFGFSALPAGSYYSGNQKFERLGYYTSFWSSTEDYSGYVYHLFVGDNGAYVNLDVKNYGRSVRCLQDN